MHRLFVYGSLMRDQPNHQLLQGSRFLGPAQTPPRYTLVDLGPYPAMLAGGETSVVGEMYEVAPLVLAELDRLEEHPHVYERSTIVLASGDSVETYLLHEHLRRGAAEISSGNWAALKIRGDRRS